MKALLLRIVRAIRFWWSRAPAAKRRLVVAQQVQQDYRINAEEAQFRADQNAMLLKEQADEYANCVAAAERALSGIGDQRIVLHGDHDVHAATTDNMVAAAPYVPEYDEDGEEILEAEPKVQRAG